MKASFESICAKEFKEQRKNKAHILPIYASSSFVFENPQEGIEIFKKEQDGYVYSRYGNPTNETVEKKLAKLESYGLELDPFALLTNSGMSAINTAICGLLKTGDKILTQGNLYGGTTELFKKILSNFGIEAILTDLGSIREIEKSIDSNPEIKMIYFETPANPTLSCIDISSLTQIAKQHGLITIVDNTFQTPYLQQPFAFGVDYVIHSTTKFLNGHGNSISGIIIGRDSGNRYKIWEAFKLMGSNCSPFEAWLLHNGLKTLPLRMDRHSDNALVLAKFLENHPRVQTVNYPGLESSPTHAIASKQMRKYGGMLSFEIKGGITEAIKFMNNLELAVLAPTLGDIDTLVLHPASSSHINVDKKIRLKNDITDGLIRVSVGIESIDDIIMDFDRSISLI